MRVLPLLLSGCLIETQVWPPPGDTDDPDLTPNDLDGDGMTSLEGDCDDGDAGNFPGNPEICDGRDNDCSNVVDDDGPLHACAAVTVHEQKLRADVLIVLDNTESMSPHWEKAAEGACAMAEHLVGPGFETQIGVVMTDMQSAWAQGALVNVSQKPGDHPWIQGDLFPLSRACTWLGFALGDVVTYMPVEEDPSGGRAAVTAAMEQTDGGPNDGFFRPDADLAILYVTDEEDTSTPENAEFLANLRKTKLGTGADVRVYAITQTGDEDCEGHKTEVEADSVLELVDGTEGMALSHCLPADQYEGFLAGVGQNIAINGLGDTFHLDAPAQLGTIEVTILDGDESYAWLGGLALIDPQTVMFTTNRPPAGSTIVFDYLQAW